MEGQLQDDAAGWWSHFYWTAYRRRRHQEPPPEEDPIALAMALYRGPHYGDRRRYAHHHHHYYRPSPSSLLDQYSPSPSATAARAARSNKRACIPASNKAIMGLKKVEFTTTMDQDDCAICLKSLADRLADREEEDTASAADAETAALRAMPCSHIFHQHCIFQWLHGNAVCPLCRHQLPTTDDDDKEEVVVEEEEEEEDDDERRERRRRFRLFLEAHVERTRRRPPMG